MVLPYFGSVKINVHSFREAFWTDKGWMIDISNKYFLLSWTDMSFIAIPMLINAIHIYQMCQRNMPDPSENIAWVWLKLHYRYGNVSLCDIELISLPPSLSLSHTHSHTFTHTCAHTQNILSRVEKTPLIHIITYTLYFPLVFFLFLFFTSESKRYLTKF